MINVVAPIAAAGIGYAAAALFNRRGKENSSDQSIKRATNEFNDMHSRFVGQLQSLLADLPRGVSAQVARDMSPLPRAVLDTLQGSANSVSGKLGELVGLLSIRNKYDRVLVLNDIVDAVAIKFNDSGVAITFLDFKSGTARLSKEQRLLRNALRDNKLELSLEEVRIDTKVINEAEQNDA